MITVNHPLGAGTPHFTYEHPDWDVSFTWDGDNDSPILVAAPGYQETPTDNIPIEIEIGGDPESVLFAFKRVCDEYLKRGPRRVH